ncbi:MAG: 4Fe-4S dicluster domain-containing protein [Candidatus Aminicenantes bacterium]|nr:4Fe-4S dicluster domain-containing protein [Candidatus Aminicenantes bacterium]
MSKKTKEIHEKVNREENLTRRGFLKATAAVSAAAALSACGSKAAFEELFQRHFKELSKEEIEKIINRLENRYSKKYGKKFSISVKGPIEGTEFAYALDLSRCIGCRRCVYACVEENNLSRSPQTHWIQVLEMEKEKGVDFHHSNLHYSHEEVPHEGHFYVPVACQQCRNTPCVSACPVQATWQEPDGIVVVDYNWCIGCRSCMAACPYGARHFNWGEPTIPAEKVNPDTHFLGNRPRYKNVVEKCTFCIQRVREGLYPKCVEACPTGARKFGNLLDPESEIRYILKNKRVLVLKEELNTQPRFYYFFAA